MKRQNLALAGVLATAAYFSGAANAAPILCETLTNDHMLVDDAYVSACVDAGVGNINGNPATDDFLLKPEGTGYAGIGGGSFTQAGTSGTFSIDAALWNIYSSIAIGFKFGTGNQPDEWFIYTLQDGVSSGTWQFVNVFRKGGGLSHLQLYSTDVPRKVPEPTTLTLLGLGLLATPLLARRRKKV